ncbi:MAG: dihydrofolate reductase family protein [Myxococcales bacterium]
MKLTTMTQITIDGVMQGNGGTSDEDRKNGFERGGWARGRGDQTTQTLINQTYQRAAAFLFGRRTYQIFESSWGVLREEEVPGWEDVRTALHRRPKYVVSTTLTRPAWSGTTVLSGDDALAAIRALKAQPGGELQVHGSGALIRWLLMNDLVDEMTLLIVPVILGQGARLFPEAGPDLALDLVESRVDSKGVVIQVLRPAGRPEYPSVDAKGVIVKGGRPQRAPVEGPRR